MDTHTPSIQSSTTFHPSTSCHTCSKIAQEVRDWAGFVKRDRSVSIAPWARFLNDNGCLICKKIVAYFESHGSKKAPQPQCIIRVTCDRGGDLSLSCEDEICPEKYCLHGKCSTFCSRYESEEEKLLQGKCVPHNHGTLYLLPPGAWATVHKESIDLFRLRQWITNCNSHHSGVCCELSPEIRVPSPSEIILIDVQTRNLVLVKSTKQYTALSYIWGKSKNNFQTNKSNFLDLQTTGSLMVHWEALPATIKDAIILTEELKIQFLWVDRLCIIQDDDDSIQQNIASMASIYINSYFTIVVAEGTNAENGLRGIEGTSGPRSYDPYYQFEDLTFCIWEEEEERSTWHTRAWTFQERAVSRRCMVFFQKTVKWECQVEVLFEHPLWKTTQTEQLHVESDRDINSNRKTVIFAMEKDGFPRHNISITPWPDVLQFGKLWSGFSGRALSHQEDSLRAFSAIISTFSPSFPGGFIYAIPEFIFDTAITWRHRERVGPRVSVFPSWSWLGWEGASEMDRWDPTARAKFRTFSQPLARWRKRNSRSGVVEDINNSYHKWDKFAVTSIGEPPPGWTCTTSSSIEGSHYQSDSIRYKGLDHYAHFSFYQPLPIASGSPSPDNTLWDPLLSGIVQAANLTIGEVFSQSQPIELYLYDSNGQWAGIMATCFNDTQEYTEGDECFVVAICKATRPRVEGQVQPYEEMSTRREVRIEDPYEFIRVLWVEWDGNIAYRRGTGRMWAKAWERQQVREISIVLG